MEAAVALRLDSEPLTFETWTQGLPSCPGCGKTMLQGLGEAELRDCWRTRRQMIPELAAMVERCAYYCAACATKQHTNRDRLEREARIDAHIVAHYNSGRLPVDAMFQTFANSEAAYEALNPETWRILREWSIAGSNLWLMGRTGLGKTYASHAVINRELRELRTAGELSALEICRLPFERDYRERLKRYIAADLLCIQDIDKGQWRADALDLLWELIDKRHKSGRIIITSNLTPEETRKAWSVTVKNDTLIETLFRRLLPMNRMEFTGDYRKVA